jgi:hypothetical protein
MSIIQCYAPTNDRGAVLLQTVIETLSRRNINVVMGDINAKVGSDNTGFEEVLVLQGLGTMNDNLVIGDTLFSHKRIHKVTWISPGHSTENQINHVCFLGSFEDHFKTSEPKKEAMLLQTTTL